MEKVITADALIAKLIDDGRIDPAEALAKGRAGAKDLGLTGEAAEEMARKLAHHYMRGYAEGVATWIMRMREHAALVGMPYNGELLGAEYLPPGYELAPDLIIEEDDQSTYETERIQGPADA